MSSDEEIKAPLIQKQSRASDSVEPENPSGIENSPIEQVALTVPISDDPSLLGNLEKAKVKLKKKGGKLKKEEILIPSELPARSESSRFRRDFPVPPNRRLEIASGLCMIEKVLMLSLVFGEVEN
uniref:Uncharacterized protein n=1 Tax=Fagus sylvatica TaxID=28930 RepID=A0A2N9FHR8_FAGSY